MTGDPLRVAVNLLWCVTGRVGGSEEYLARQLEGLRRVDPDGVEVQPVIHASADWARAHRDLIAQMEYRRAPVGMGSRPVRILAEHSWLAMMSRGADVVHHGGGTLPAIGPRPRVLTIHDVQYLTLPQHFSAVKLAYLRAMVPRSVCRADVVATPSRYVRDTLVEAFDLDFDRTCVVPHGFEPPDPAVVREAAASVRQRYRLGDGPVLVYPAITHPHKRHDLLLDALASHWRDPDLRLVLIGGPGAADAEVSARIEGLGLGSRVLRPGRVPTSDRDALVSIADALVFPSSYEGFGAPLIEAMALGTPVICGDHPTLREVVGDAAVIVPTPGGPTVSSPTGHAEHVAAWAEAWDQARTRRSELVVAGYARVAAFSLEASGAALRDAYRRAVS